MCLECTEKAIIKVKGPFFSRHSHNYVNQNDLSIVREGLKGFCNEHVTKVQAQS
jgi:hypothetical protein